MADEEKKEKKPKAPKGEAGGEGKAFDIFGRAGELELGAVYGQVDGAQLALALLLVDRDPVA